MWTAAGAITAASALGAMAAPATAHAAGTEQAVAEAAGDPPTEANGTGAEVLGLGAVVVVFAVATIRRLRRAA
jgi:hypothetical protein